MILIKVVFALSFMFLGIKIYYSIKIKDKNKNKNTEEVIGDIFGGTYGGSAFFPILRKPRDSNEKKLIKKANIAISLFWSFFLLAMLLILLLIYNTK